MVEPGSVALSPELEQSLDLLWLVDHATHVAPATTVEEVERVMRAASLSEIAVCEDGRLLGVCTRAQIGALLGSRFGYSVCARKPITQYMKDDTLAVTRGTVIGDVLSRALSREGQSFHDAIAVLEAPSNDAAAGSFVGFIGVPTLYRLQAELLRHHTRLLEQARDEALHAAELKTRFLANMSHEIRTPMNGVLGFLDLLSETALEEDQREFVQTAQHSARTLLRLLDDILDLSRVEAGKLPLIAQPFDLHESIHEVGALLRLQASMKGLAFTVAIEPGTPRMVVADRLRIAQIVLNLGGNAVKFTQEGEVRILVALEESDEHHAMVRLTIEDTGIGIDPADVERLFEPFAQADSSTTRRFGGTGLGLAIVRQLAQLMGGSLSAEARAEGGSRFHARIRLPVARESDRPLPRPGLAAPDVSLAGLRVLVVEDNPVNAKLAERMLQRLGCSVSHAVDGAEALSSLDREPADVVLMDCQMPTMDGYEAARRIRAREQARSAGRALPIIGLTAHAMAGDRERCLASGMTEYLTKPIDMERLRATIVATIEVGAPIPCPS